MKLSDRAIDYPKLVILGAVLLCLCGVAAMFTLPKERAPRVKLPVVMVLVPNPGAPPATNEAQIIRKIEEETGTLKGLKAEGGIYSHALNGAALMQFVFEDDVSVTEAKRDVESLINRVKGEFPPEAQQNPGPLVNDIGYENVPIIQVFVAGGNDGRHRRRIAERLQARIETVAGVAGVDIFGGLEEEVQIEVDPHRMALYGFNYEQVESAIRRANHEAPTGAIEGSGGGDMRVRTPGKLQSTDEIAEIPVGVKDGKAVRLADIAVVRMGNKPLTSMARYGGQDAAVLVARPKTDIDVLKTSEAIQTLVDDFQQSGQHEGTQIGTVRSQAREVKYMLGQLTSNAWQGTMLVIIMLWIVFGWRNAGVISLSFPFCLLVTFALLWLVKHTFWPDLAINNMVLYSMILIIGEVADGSIVVGENIYRHREMGRPPAEAARLAMREVGTPILFAYITTVASFAPLFLVGGIMGEFLQVLPVVTICALIAAALVDHFLLPVVSVYLMKPKKIVARPAGAENMSQDEEEIANAEAMAAESPLKRRYGWALSHALANRRLVLGLSAFAMSIPPLLVWSGAVGFELFPEADVPVVEVHFELPLGSSMEKKTAKVAEQIEQAVVRAVRPDEWYRPSENAARVRPVTTIGDAGTLNTRLDQTYGSGPEFGTVYVELELAQDRDRTAAEIRRAIENELPPMPDVIVRVTSPREGPPAGAPVLVRVMAQRETSYETLAEKAQEIERILRGIPGTRDITNDYRIRPELVATPDRAVASLFGVDAAQISTSVNYALDGVRVGSVDFGGDKEIDLRLRNLTSDRDQIEDLQNLPIRSPNGKIVTLEQVAQVERSMAAHVIEHYDQKRVISVRCNLEGGVLPDDVKAALVTAMRPDLNATQKHALVHDHDNKIIKSDEAAVIEFGGENEMRDEAQRDLNMALLIALAANFVIFIFQFNSFTQPFIVLASVPMALIGVAIGLLLFGLHFSVSAMIGIVALSGIAVDNAMVILEFANKMRAAGLPLEKAVTFACQLRLRPLLLTTATNVVGMIPVALNVAGGGELWQPLSVAIMSGLGFGLIVQLFVVPLMYVELERRSEEKAIQGELDDEQATTTVATA